MVAVYIFIIRVVIQIFVRFASKDRIWVILPCGWFEFGGLYSIIMLLFLFVLSMLLCLSTDLFCPVLVLQS